MPTPARPTRAAAAPRRPGLAHTLALAVLLLTAPACQGDKPWLQPIELDLELFPGGTKLPRITVAHSDTVPGVGAAQGAVLHDGYVFVYGDADNGVIRQCRVKWDLEGKPFLEPTGVDVALTRKGKDLIPHPTGLTFHPQHGAYIGNTVAGKGTIFHINWFQALRDGHLDRAVLNEIEDDAAVNGCRPEFIRWQGRDLLASADYGDKSNELRLYDPSVLARCLRTSDRGALVARVPTGPFVQSLLWRPHESQLILIQNPTEGLGYRLTSVTVSDRFQAQEPVDFKEPRDELEGFVILNDRWCLFVNSSQRENIWFATLDAPAP